MRSRPSTVRSAGLVVGLLALLAPLTSAQAHQSPPGCSGGGSIVNFAPGSGLGIIHRNGDQLNLGIQLSNNAPNVCDVSDADISIQLPDPDGTLGAPIDVVTGRSLPAGTAPQIVATVPYTVDFDPGVYIAPVKITDTATLHGSTDSTGTGTLQTNIYISRPHVTLTVTPTPASGPAPLSTTFSYAVSNDSTSYPADPIPALQAPTADHAVLDDDTCDSLTFTGGDTTVTSPPLLQSGETWTFTCTHLFAAPGTFVNHVSVVGGSTRDGRPWPQTTAQSSVTAIGPDLTVTKSHAGAFVAGDTGRTYELTVRNAGNAPTTGPVGLADQLPGGLTATAIAGTGWSCTTATLRCTRPDPLAAGAAYPPVTVTVDVAAAAPPELTNRASVSGGGEVPGAAVNNGAADPTAITPSNAFTIDRAKSNRDGGATLTVTVPGAGGLSADDGSAAPARSVPRRPRDYLKAASADAAGAGTVKLRLRPSRKAKRKLKAGKRLRTSVTVNFIPTGGTASEQVTEVRLRRGHRPGR